MLSFFEKIKNLETKIETLEFENNKLQNRLEETEKKLNSKQYKYLIELYNDKERGLLNKAINIIKNKKEKYDFNLNLGFVCCDFEILGEMEFIYKELLLKQKGCEIKAYYKGFEFNKENAKILYDLHCSVRPIFKGF